MAEDIIDVCVTLRISRLEKMFSRRLKRALWPYGLSGEQVATLALLARGSTTAKVLGDTFGSDKSTMSRNLKRLEERGFVTIGRPQGRRGSSIDITENGLEALVNAAPAWKRMNDVMLAELNPAGRSALDHLTRTMTRR